MKIRLLPILLLMATTASAQSYETQFTRSLHDVMDDVQKRFGIRLKYDMDTTGLKVAYADFRIRPYLETLTALNSDLLSFMSSRVRSLL